MIFVWRGLGPWTLVVPILVAFGLAELNRWMPFSLRGPHAVLAVLAITGAITTAWGLVANRGPGSLVIDPLTGHEFVLRTRHSLYGVPMQVWGLIELGAALALGIG